MPKETALYQVMKGFHFASLGLISGGVKTETFRNATQEEFNKFMKLHDASIYPVSEESTLAMKHNFDLKKINDLTLTRIDFDSGDGRHHVAYELSSKNNDYHTIAIHDEAALKLSPDGSGLYLNYSVNEFTAKTGFFGDQIGLVTPVFDTSHQDQFYNGGVDNGREKLLDFFDVDTNPSHVKVLHEDAPSDYITIIG